MTPLGGFIYKNDEYTQISKMNKYYTYKFECKSKNLSTYIFLYVLLLQL